MKQKQLTMLNDGSGFEVAMVKTRKRKPGRKGRIAGSKNIVPAKTGEAREYCATCNKRRYLSTMIIQKAMYGKDSHYCNTACHNKAIIEEKRRQLMNRLEQQLDGFEMHEERKFNQQLRKKRIALEKKLMQKLEATMKKEIEKIG